MFSLKRMAHILNVSRSGYYQWCKAAPENTARRQRRIDIDCRVKSVFDAGKGRDGSERIFAELEEQGQPLNIKTIRKSLKRQGLVPKAAKLFKVTTDSNHTQPIAPNLLERNFTASKPNEKVQKKFILLGKFLSRN